MTAKIFNRWGDPSYMEQLRTQRELASRFGAQEDDHVHGMDAHQLGAFSSRAKQVIRNAGLNEENLMQGLVTGTGSHHSATRSLIEKLLPTGRTLDVRGANPFKRSGQVMSNPTWGGLGGGSSSSLWTAMQPYQPEFASPDRQMFPIHRRLANNYWRLFYKMDPTIGAVIEMLSELPWSDFQLAGEGVDGEVKETYDYMCQETRLRTILPRMVVEWLVIGEVIPHTFWDDSKGIWTHIALHNPDQINVVYSPFIKMDPIMEFVPDPKLRELATSTHPLLQRVKETLPNELVTQLQTGENIPLNPLNATFIPKKLFYYDLRGTSILSRMWRILMAEDALWSAFIATARRGANPLKLIKLGDPTTGTIPPPTEEKRVAQLLAQAEADPMAFLIYNYQIQHELIGAPERLMSINTHYDLVERIKLVALGVSKSFISGEVSFSSAAAGLTVFLQRLKAMRDFFVNEWLIPKYFLPVAIANKWIKPSKKGGGSGHVRVKRSARELSEEALYIVPTIEWSKTLDPTIDRERIDAMQALENSLGIKITDAKKYAAMGLDSAEEQKQLVEEVAEKRRLAGKDPLLQQMLGLVPQTPEGEPGAGLSPGIPPDAFGMPGGGGGEGEGGAPPPPPPGGEAPMPEGASLSADEGAQPKPGSDHWDDETLTPLVQLFREFDVKALADAPEPWATMAKDKEVILAADTHDPVELWSAVESWLIDENYPTQVYDALRDALMARGVLERVAAREVSDVDAEFELLATQLVGNIDDSGDFNPLGTATKSGKP